jgi:hypothetical protein
VRTESIVRNDHKVYKGQAYVQDEQTKQWRYCGWTRITVLRDGSDPLFEGVFVREEDVYHVKLLSKYNLQKDLADVEFEFDDTEEKMVVYRDSDRFISQTKLLQRSAGIVSSYEANMTMCTHDRLEFNQQIGENPRGMGLDLMGRLVRRQDTGNIATGGSRAQLASTVGDTNGCSSTRQVALVAAAADCAYVTNFGNASATRSNIISIYNQVCQ